MVTHKNSLHVYIDIGKRNQIKTTRDSVVIEKKNCTGTLEATFGTKETLYGSSPNGLVLLLLFLLLVSPSFFFFAFGQSFDSLSFRFIRISFNSFELTQSYFLFI